MTTHLQVLRLSRPLALRTTTTREYPKCKAPNTQPNRRAVYVLLHMIPVHQSCRCVTSCTFTAAYPMNRHTSSFNCCYKWCLSFVAMPVNHGTCTWYQVLLAAQPKNRYIIISGPCRGGRSVQQKSHFYGPWTGCATYCARDTAACGSFCFLFFSHTSCIHFPASGQAVVTGVVRSFPRFLPSIVIARRVQQSHCSSIFHRVLLTRTLSRFPQVNLCARKRPHEFIRVFTRGDSNSRN